MYKICGSMLAATILFGCSTPNLKYAGIEPKQFSDDRVTVDVYIIGDQAQAIRTDTSLQWRSAALTDAISYAVRQVSGCNEIELVSNQENSVVDYELMC